MNELHVFVNDIRQLKSVVDFDSKKNIRIYISPALAIECSDYINSTAGYIFYLSTPFIMRNSDCEKLSKIYREGNYKGILIIDADGLNALSEMDNNQLKNATCQVILTPHPKEFSRLIGRSVDEILENPIELAREFAWDNHCTVLLKGPTTIVTDGNEVILVDRGCAGMATAGSGDVLSGIAAAVCAANSGEIVRRVATAAYVNGLAGELAQESSGSISMIASDTVAHIAGAVKEICGI